MTFKDHFSENSRGYAAHRPRYPDELFAYLATLCSNHDVAWDCATGSGQAAHGLARYFDQVRATDASARQIASAAKIEGVVYTVATAENSGFESASVDLITVAQAFHWFDIPAFSQEVSRVLKTNGVLAVWTYGLPNVSSAINQTLDYLYEEILGSFWPPERKLVEEGYASTDLPLNELACSDFDMLATWNFSQFIGYLNTWSAGRRYEAARGHNPTDAISADFLSAWGSPEQRREIRWPLTLRVWRKTS